MIWIQIKPSCLNSIPRVDDKQAATTSKSKAYL